MDAVNKSLDDVIKERKKEQGKQGKKGVKGTKGAKGQKKTGTKQVSRKRPGQQRQDKKDQVNFPS